MEAFGIVVITVLVIGVLAGLYAARSPVNWDDLGGESRVDPSVRQPTRIEDEDDLRALVAAKRAKRLAEGGPAVGSDARAAPQIAPWAYLDDDLVQEARDLVARKRARLTRDGRTVPDEQAELERLLGPP